MTLTMEQKEALSKQYTDEVMSGGGYKKKQKPGGTFKDREGSRPPLNLGKEAGQPNSNSGFSKGKVF